VRHRTAAGWSQEQLASKCQLAGWDISRDIVARIERRIRALTDADMAKLAMVFRVPLEELYPRDVRGKLPKKR
jgi:transcriptional regulator with XRE-family HTH domain